MEFERSADGTLKPLPAPSIDTGMGLERITAVLQGKESNYDTDLFTPLLSEIGTAVRAQLRRDDERIRTCSMRVVADHIRATTFLIADGVIPSNEWRGYVLRKIMRRAMRHGKHLGFTEPFLHGSSTCSTARWATPIPSCGATARRSKRRSSPKRTASKRC